MWEHHRQVIGKLIEHFCLQPEYLALIITGSLAQGTGKEDSDIDAVLVSTADEFERRKQSHSIVWGGPEWCDYEHGYVDGKVVDMDFLLRAVDHASEPTRFWFAGAVVPYTEMLELPEVLGRISRYPEHERDRKMKSFLSQLWAHHWYMSEAERKNDRFLATTAAWKLVLYGGRLILAYNRILYPYYKQLMPSLQSAPNKPANFLELAERLLAEPTMANADVFYKALMDFRDWENPVEGLFDRWVQDIEWKWLDGMVSMEDY